MCQSDFSLDGNLGELERLAACVGEFCAVNALDDEAEFQLNLVLEELFVNTLRHGGCAGVPDSARVCLRRAGDGVEVDFRDRGHPFDPTVAPAVDIAAPLAERDGVGLGLHLVRKIVSDLAYRRDGEWNRITMRRLQEGAKNL